MTIAGLWIGATVALTLSTVRQGAPQEIKALMTPGLLLVSYGLVWAVRWAWNRHGARVHEIR